jgi:hypothetical protein
MAGQVEGGMTKPRLAQQRSNNATLTEQYLRANCR